MSLDYNEIIGICNEIPALYYLHLISPATETEVRESLGRRYSNHLRNLKKSGEVEKDGGRGISTPYYITKKGEESLEAWESAHKKDAKKLKCLIFMSVLGELDLPSGIPALCYLDLIGDASYKEMTERIGKKYSDRLKSLERVGDADRSGERRGESGKGTGGQYYITEDGKKSIRVWEDSHQEDARVLKSLISKICR